VRFAVLVFRFFASLHLAIFLLLGLGGVFAVGTFIESAYGTEAAKGVVYQSPWMSLLLILLALNVTAAALDRLPWKRKHTGFVITHAGILLILTGSLVTRAFGIEGQMAIPEGGTESRIILNEPFLQLVFRENGSVASVPIPHRPFPWKGRERLYGEPTIWLRQYLPKASRKEEVQESLKGSPALAVVLESSFMKANHWLVLEDPERSEILLGPAQLRFAKEKLTAPKKLRSGDFLEFQFKDRSVKIPIPDRPPHAIPLKGTPYKVSDLRIFRNAEVQGNQLVDVSPEWENPACEFFLEGGGMKEKHTVFSKFPDFPTIHGRKPSRAGAQIFYRRPSEEFVPPNELRFVWQEAGLPLYQVRKGDRITDGSVKLGEEYETGWMDFKFRVERYYPHAKIRSVFREEPVSSQAEDHGGAIELEAEGKGKREIFWLGQGEDKELRFQDRSLHLIYGLKTTPVGFRLKLRDFRVEHYPGTGQPSSFESDVTLKDDSQGTLRDLTIRMNQPLVHGGVKVFQSGYQQPQEGPEVSIFSVAKDPGIPIKYGGAIVMIVGILLMFYSRRWSNQEKREQAVFLLASQQR